MGGVLTSLLLALLLLLVLLMLSVELVLVLGAPMSHCYLANAVGMPTDWHQVEVEPGLPQPGVDMNAVDYDEPTSRYAAW